MERTELPTASRLQELREQGVVPYSSFTSRTAGALAVLVSLLILAPQFKVLLTSLREVLYQDDLHALLSLDKEHSMQMLQAVLIILIVPAIAGLMGAFAVGLFQTRFFIRVARVSPAFGRLNPFNNGIKELFVRIGFLVTTVFLSLLFSALFFRLVIREILSLANSDAREVPLWLEPFFEAVLPILIVVLVFSGFAAFLISRRRFLEAHKMTRAEVAQEGNRA